MEGLLGSRRLTVGGDRLGHLADCNELLQDTDLLRRRMAEDGYLLIRGLLNPDNVQSARTCLLENLAANGQLDVVAPMEKAIINPGANGSFLGGRTDISHSKRVLSVVEAPELFHFFSGLLGHDALTFDYKWLRVVGANGFTGAHYDIVYMGRGTQELYTCWIPLGDVEFNLGPLAILVGSHNLESYRRIRDTYGRMDVDRDNVEGWFSSEPVDISDKYGGKWCTTEFKMGDVIIFGMHTMHCSLVNTTNCFRLSCDVRFQRSDEPTDERWIGDRPIGHYAWGKKPGITMEAARERWRV